MTFSPNRSPLSSPLMDETALLMKFIAEVPEYMPNVRVFRRTIVNASVQKNGRHFHIKAGIKGQADAYALALGGLHVEVETKAAKGRMLEEQKAWRAWCLDWKIPHLVLRAKTNEHPASTVERWIAELRAVLESSQAAVLPAPGRPTT